jgi:hypothetical protein
VLRRILVACTRGEVRNGGANYLVSDIIFCMYWNDLIKENET